MSESSTDVPHGLLARLREPVPDRLDRIEAGRRRLLAGPVEPLVLAGALLGDPVGGPLRR